MEMQFDISTKFLKQMLLDQQTLAKQMESTGNAVAQLTFNQMRARQKWPPSPASRDGTEDLGFTQCQPQGPSGLGPGRAGVPPHRTVPRDRGHHGEHTSSRTFMPKMQFPTFDGSNPCIWKEKCEDYFRIFDLLETMWPTIATLHMEDMSAKWLKVYKLKNGLGDWKSFIATVEKKFGNDDYREALTHLLELQQQSTLEQYVSDFEEL